MQPGTQQQPHHPHRRRCTTTTALPAEEAEVGEAGAWAEAWGPGRGITRMACRIEQQRRRPPPRRRPAATATAMPMSMPAAWMAAGTRIGPWAAGSTPSVRTTATLTTTTTTTNNPAITTTTTATVAAEGIAAGGAAAAGCGE